MENFDRENIDELLEICQIRHIFPPQNFAPYGILAFYRLITKIRCECASLYKSTNIRKHTSIATHDKPEGKE